MQSAGSSVLWVSLIFITIFSQPLPIGQGRKWIFCATTRSEALTPTDLVPISLLNIFHVAILSASVCPALQNDVHVPRTCGCRQLDQLHDVGAAWCAKRSRPPGLLWAPRSRNVLRDNEPRSCLESTAATICTHTQRGKKLSSWHWRTKGRKALKAASCEWTSAVENRAVHSQAIN